MTAEFEIPLALNTLETHYFIVRNVPTYYAQTALLKTVDTTTIQNIQSSRGSIQSLFQDIEFKFVDRISVFAVSRSNPNLKREMYYLDINPINTGVELRMLNSLTNLKPILSEEYIDIEIRLNVRQVVPQNIRARMDFGYVVL